MEVAIRATTDYSASAKTFFNDAVTTVTNIKTTRGLLYFLSLTNTVAATSYLQIFFQPASSVVLGTTVPDLTIRLKTNAGAGDERDLPFPVPIGGQILLGGSLGANASGPATGLSVAGTTTATGATTAAVSVAAVYV